jgi:hypothetical protein
VRQLALAKIACPHSAIEAKIGGSPHRAHETNDLLLNEQIIDDLRAPTHPIRQLRLTDGPQVIALPLVQANPHCRVFPSEQQGHPPLGLSGL